MAAGITIFIFIIIPLIAGSLAEVCLLKWIEKKLNLKFSKVFAFLANIIIFVTATALCFFLIVLLTDFLGIE